MKLWSHWDHVSAKREAWTHCKLLGSAYCPVDSTAIVHSISDVISADLSFHVMRLKGLNHL